MSLADNSDDNVVAKNRAYDNDLINVSPNADETICGGIGGQMQPQPMTAGRRVQAIGIRVEGSGAERNLFDGNHIVRAGVGRVLLQLSPELTSAGLVANGSSRSPSVSPTSHPDLDGAEEKEPSRRYDDEED